MPPQHPVTHHRFSITDYHRMGEAGILSEDARVELIEGELLEMTPIGSRHAGTVRKLDHLLSRLVGDRALVDTQNPLVLGDSSEPGPDLMLLRPREDFYTDAHPGAEDVLLVVEVADTSLAYDRNVKIPLYARYGVPEAWLIDLTNNRIDIYQEPAQHGYQRILRPERPERIAVPGLGQELDLNDLL